MSGHPVIAFALVTVIGFALLAAATVAVGWLLKTYALPEHGFGRADEQVNVWLADHRTPLRTDASFWLSGIGDVYAIPALVAISTIINRPRKSRRPRVYIDVELKEIFCSGINRQLTDLKFFMDWISVKIFFSITQNTIQPSFQYFSKISMNCVSISNRQAFIIFH